MKFGSSVLRQEGDLPTVVREIRRWLDGLSRVVAVVSAIGNTTDILFNQANRYGDSPSEEAVAALVATGETASAALLALALHSDGIPATILDPKRIGLQAEGSLLDSILREVDVKCLRRGLTDSNVVVVPGFIALDADGRTALLGRGGSDLTALFLAQKLGASHCRLIKDVDGLYEADPNAGNGSHPRRFQTVHWLDALRLDGGIVQHKAMQFAADHRLSFEVAALAGRDATTVGGGETTFCGATSANPSRA